MGNQLLVPKFAANNYMRKEVAGPDPTALRATAYFTEWPALQYVHTERPSRAIQCPANMHMLAWHYSDAERGGSVDVRAFPLSRSAAYFKSRLFHEDIDAANPTFKGYFSSFTRTGFPDSHDLGVQADEELPPFAATSMLSSRTSGGEYVFIPNSHVVSFKCSTGSCPILLMCFVDASNLNLFRDATSFIGEVAATEAGVHAALMLPEFEVDLPKYPSDLTLNSYLSVALQSETGENAAVEPPIVVPTNRRDRRKKSDGTGGADFKNWQDLTRWKMLIASITLQKPAAPTILQTRRHQATISWSSPFVPFGSDKTSFGFNVIFCPIEGDRLLQEHFLFPFSPSLPSQELASGCGSQRFVRGADASSLLERVDEALLRRTGVSAPLFTAEVGGLQPDSSYQFRLSVFYDQKESPLSSFTAATRTAPLSAPSSPGGVLPARNIEVPPNTLRIGFRALKTAYKGGIRTIGELQFAVPIGQNCVSFLFTLLSTLL